MYDFPLTGYWPLSEGEGQVVRDRSGNGNHGQLGSTPDVDANDPSWIKGAFFWSYGLHFDGGMFVTIPDSDDLEPQQVTVSTWFRGTRSPGEFKYLVAKGLFIDGQEIGSGMTRGAGPIGYGTPAGNTTIGTYGGTCDLSLTGDLDGVSIWNKALPVAEIWQKASVFFAPH